jgi:hypothetical protein
MVKSFGKASKKRTAKKTATKKTVRKKAAAKKAAPKKATRPRHTLGVYLPIPPKPRKPKNGDKN